jgi:hypothetical protein
MDDKARDRMIAFVLSVIGDSEHADRHSSYSDTIAAGDSGDTEVAEYAVDISFHDTSCKVCPLLENNLRLEHEKEKEKNILKHNPKIHVVTPSCPDYRSKAAHLNCWLATVLGLRCLRTDWTVAVDRPRPQ